jgi:hypothetical protein
MILEVIHINGSQSGVITNTGLAIHPTIVLQNETFESKVDGTYKLLSELLVWLPALDMLHKKQGLLMKQTFLYGSELYDEFYRCLTPFFVSLVLDVSLGFELK